LRQEEKSLVPVTDFYDFDNRNEVLERYRNRIQNDIRNMVLTTTQFNQNIKPHE
jgi:hypothetical protein